MSNMSYCRFQNTLEDLRDCANWLAEHEPTKELSAEELKAFERLIKVCEWLAGDYGEAQ
jgi:hypothetical protein